MRAVARNAGPSKKCDLSVSRRWRCQEYYACTPLGTTPRTEESGPVYVELGLAKTIFTRSTARVGSLLNATLDGDVRINETAQGDIAAQDKVLYEELEDESGIACPGIQVVWILRAGTGDN
jgi:hypothetical protein